jgi:hypothetical protein
MAEATPGGMTANPTLPTEPQPMQPGDVPQVMLPSQPDPNQLDTNALFTCDETVHRDHAPPRYWRLTGAQYANVALQLLGRDAQFAIPAAVTALDGTRGTQYTNVAGLLGMDPPTLEALVDSASLLADDWVEGAYTRSNEGHVTCLKQATVTDACITSFIREFLTRGFRRPPSPEELSRYVERMRPLATKGGAEVARAAITTLFASPELLFRSERGVEQPGSPLRRLDAWEVANALALTLTNAPPDGELQTAARRNELQTSAQIRAQANRLLAKSPGFTQRFFEEFIKYRNVLSVMKPPEVLAAYNQRGVETKDTRIVDATRARLATDATMPQFFNRFLLGLKGSGPDQAGILTDRSFLWAYSQPDSTDPIRRGRFITEQLLCNRPPHIDLATVPEFKDSPTMTMRERLQAHSTRADCSACHRVLDGIGLGLERFDDLGVWRDTEKGKPLVTTGELLGAGSADGPFNGPVELSEKLAASPRARQCFVRQVFRFTAGRNESATDACFLKRADAQFASAGNLSDLIVDYFASDAFLVRTEEARP